MSSTIKNTMNDAVSGVKHGLHSAGAHHGNASYHTSHTSQPMHSSQSMHYSSVPVTSHHSTSQYASHGHSAGGYSVQGHSTSIVATSSTNTRKISEVVKGDPLVLPSNAYEQSRRQVSSVIVYEEDDKLPENNVRYVEVPQYEEVIRHVPVKQIREVEKIVPKIVEEWIERIVEVPQTEEVVREVEIPQIQEVVKHVPKVEIVDRPYEVIKHVPRIEVQKVEKTVDVYTETIEIPTAVIVEERVSVSDGQARDAMLIVSQKVKPVIVDGGREVTVDVVEYEPEVMPVDIHIAKFVEQELVMVGAKETIHRVVTVPAAQYNSMIRFLNIHLSEEEIQNLPYLRDASGQISFLPRDYEWHAPQEGLKIYGYVAGTIYGQGTPVISHHQSRSTMSRADVQARQSELDRQFQHIFQQFESERHRRVAAVEDFNRQQEIKVRNLMSSSSTYGVSRSTSYRGLATGLNHSTPMGTTQGSIAYQTGHAVGSAVGSVLRK